jgi:hypothetical protein
VKREPETDTAPSNAPSGRADNSSVATAMSVLASNLGNIWRRLTKPSARPGISGHLTREMVHHFPRGQSPAKSTLARTPQIGIICVVALLSGCNRGAPNKETSPSVRTTGAVADVEVSNLKPYPFRFVAYGDMRFAERESYGQVIANAKARQEIIDQITNESPAFLVTTGDFCIQRISRGRLELLWQSMQHRTEGKHQP